MSAQRGEQPTEPTTAGEPMPRQRRRTGVAVVAVIALVVGIGIGALAGYLVFGAGERAGESAAGDAEIACRLAEHITDSHDSEDDWGPLDKDPAIWQAQALSGLLSAAAIEDERYDDLAETGIEVLTAVQRVDLAQLTAELKSVVSSCAAL